MLGFFSQIGSNDKLEIPDPSICYKNRFASISFFFFLHLFAVTRVLLGLNGQDRSQIGRMPSCALPFVFTNVFFPVCALKDYASAKAL